MFGHTHHSNGSSTTVDVIATLLGCGESEMIQKMSDLRVLDLRMEGLGMPLWVLERLTTRKQRKISTGRKASRGSSLKAGSAGTESAGWR